MNTLSVVLFQLENSIYESNKDRLYTLQEIKNIYFQTNIRIIEIIPPETE